MELIRNVVREIVRNVVSDVIDAIISIPDDIFGMSVTLNPKLEGVVDEDEFTDEQIIGLIFNFKL